MWFSDKFLCREIFKFYFCCVSLFLLAEHACQLSRVASQLHNNAFTRELELGKSSRGRCLYSVPECALLLLHSPLCQLFDTGNAVHRVHIHPLTSRQLDVTSAPILLHWLSLIMRLIRSSLPAVGRGHAFSVMAALRFQESYTGFDSYLCHRSRLRVLPVVEHAAPSASTRQYRPCSKEQQALPNTVLPITSPYTGAEATQKDVA